MKHISIMELDNNNNYYDDYLYYIDKSIQTGDIKFISFAIKKYETVLDKYYIEWGYRLIEELGCEAFGKLGI